VVPVLVNPMATIDFKIGATNYRGGVSVALGDLDGDHKQDLIVGRNYGRPTIVEDFSGLLKDMMGRPLQLGAAIDPFDKNVLKPTYALGVRVAAIDIDFDGIADIITASGGNNKSTVDIYSGADHHLLRSFTALPHTPNSALFTAGTSVSPVFVLAR
jgi:serralysin